MCTTLPNKRSIFLLNIFLQSFRLKNLIVKFEKKKGFCALLSPLSDKKYLRFLGINLACNENQAHHQSQPADVPPAAAHRSLVVPT